MALEINENGHFVGSNVNRTALKRRYGRTGDLTTHTRSSKVATRSQWMMAGTKWATAAAAGSYGVPTDAYRDVVRRVVTSCTFSYVDRAS
jgi:hypothetical protein